MKDRKARLVTGITVLELLGCRGGAESARSFEAGAPVAAPASGAPSLGTAVADNRDAGPEPAPANSQVVSGIPMHPAVATLVAKRHIGDTEEMRQQQLFDVLEPIAKEQSPIREAVLLNAIDQGLHDPPSWVAVESRYQGHVARIRVSTDALKVNGVRVNLSAIGAQHVADRLGTILPTARILDLVWQNAALKLEPCAMPPDKDMHSTKRMFDHSRCVDRRIAGRPGLAANVGKNWVVSNALEAETNRAANYGWFRRGQRPIQTVGTRHDKVYADYSQIVRLVDPVVTVDGHNMDIRAVARSHELWGLVSDEGPLDVWRMALRDSHAKAPVERVPGEPPAEFPSGSAPLVALAPTGLPVPLVRLPDQLLGIRHARQRRSVADALGVDEGDLPEEAYWSASATFCGYHDLFFELVTGTAPRPPELASKTEELQRALACGRSGAALLQTRTLYEMDYLFQGEPVSFGALRAAPGAPAIAPAYPALPHPPPGARAAACRDPDLSGGLSCHHGDRSRVLLEVDGGTIGTRAREATSLLQLLGQARAPSDSVKQLHALYTSLENHDVVRVERAATCAAAFDGPLSGPPSAATSRIDLFHTLMDHAEFCAVGRTGNAVNGRVEFVYVPKSDASAHVIQAALRRRMMAIRFEEPTADATGPAEARYRIAKRDILRRAIASARVEEQNGRISLTLLLAANEGAEKSALAAYTNERKRTFARAAKMVRDAADGRPIDAVP